MKGLTKKICRQKMSIMFNEISINEEMLPKYTHIYIGGAHGVKEMDTATRVQILDEADYISHSTNTLGKGMNPIILPPVMGK